jgi:hypothetical protein
LKQQGKVCPQITRIGADYAANDVGATHSAFVAIGYYGEVGCVALGAKFCAPTGFGI